MPTANRRDFILGTISGCLMASTGRALANTEGWDTFVEVQYGDPNLPEERVSVNPETIARLASAETRAQFGDRYASFQNSLLGEAVKHLGSNRVSTPEKVASYLDIFNLPFRTTNGYTPYCASGIVYVAACCYCDSYKKDRTISALRSVLAEIDRYHFYPSPSVLDMVNVAKGKRKWRERKAGSPKPGWLVVFDWKKKGAANHVGIVDKLQNGRLSTIEFNTSDDNPSNGGRVERKQRAFDETVLGFIATDARAPFEM